MSMYITLSSNSDDKYFPDNTLTHFFNKLPTPLNLDQGNWEVGLAEIQYPINWYNIQTQDIWMYFSLPEEREYIIIPTGHYRNKRAFIKLLNSKIHSIKKKTLKDAVHFHYDSITQKAAISRKKTDVVVGLSEKLERILGFPKKFWVTDQMFSRVEGKDPIDLTDNLHHLYIHTNIVEFRPVAHTLIPLLRILPIITEDIVANTTHSFENIHYMPVRHQVFETIEIYITDGTGAKIPFERGTVLITLHLKQVS